MSENHHLIFDRARVRTHLARADEDFLLREMLTRVADRLEDVKREFPLVLEIGSRGLLEEYLPATSRIVTLGGDVLADEEALPFADHSFDLVVACGSLHWVNDVPGTLVQIRRLLKPDGLFLAVLPGGETLSELRQCFEAVEMKISGGISPRVSPFIDIRDAGSLLQRAGFTLPVVDSERIEIHYRNPFALMHELRRMGQTNALLAARKYFTSRSLMMGVADFYTRHFPAENGRIRATFELLALTAWAPHASQPQPAKRGSGQLSLSILGE
jgi:SAM-dependent methyltransferase